VLDSEVDSLLDVSVLDLLVDDDTDCALGDVVDNARLSVVDLVWHALLNSSVGLDINDVSDFVLAQVGRQLDHTLLTEISRESIASASSQSGRVTHAVIICLITGRRGELVQRRRIDLC